MSFKMAQYSLWTERLPKLRVHAKLLQVNVSVQSYKFIRQTRPDVKRPGYGYKGRWPGVLAHKAPYV